MFYKSIGRRGSFYHFKQNKRPIAHLRKQFKLLNKYDNIITLIKRRRKQEAHGPHRSPEKTVQINKHI